MWKDLKKCIHCTANDVHYNCNNNAVKHTAVITNDRQ